jgi:hypothetical protein
MKLKTKLLYALSGALAALLLTSALPVLAAQIEAAFNIVNIVVDGKSVAKTGESYKLADGTEVPYSIAYKGTTYLPLKKLGEILGFAASWDGETSTANVSSDVKPESVGGNVVSNVPDTTKTYREVPKLSEMSYEEFRECLTYSMEIGNKLTEPYNEIGPNDMPVGAPYYHFHLTFGNNFNENEFIAEWNQVSVDTIIHYKKTLSDEYSNRAPYNTIAIHLEYNGLELHTNEHPGFPQ